MNNLCKLLLLGYLVCLVLPLVTSKNIICYQGQSYWCRNITTAVECNTVKHCIQGVWEKEIPIEEDKSSVCQTCMDMVKMARSQLESNETQEELRQVLEGTCMVIPEKHLRNDCDKLMDDFGSYIVDTLASQMNPSVVCSVAGLCYSEKFKVVKIVRQLDCESCEGVMGRIESNIEAASTTDLQDVLNNVCRNLGTFSDVCVSLLAKHMVSVDSMIRNNIKAQPVCDLAGVCTERYHAHPDRIEVSVAQDSTDVLVFGKHPLDDDLSCEFCQQLVKHLRDVLIANTTEEEFKMVLEGLCKMSEFKEKCVLFIDQYYQAVYNFLVKELDGKALCTQIKICNNTSNYKDDVTESPSAVEEVQAIQLPIERMKMTYVPQNLKNIQENPEVCSFCEYFLHFVQQEITLPSSEREITEVVERACNKLPATIKGQCDSFVDTYMDQFIAILANRLDPSQVCPSLGACKGMLLAVEYKDQPTCPLCLLAIGEALRKAQNRSESAIGDVLDDLCMRDEFPTSVLVECAKFVTGFKDPITDMIMADFTSEEACVYIDLCSPPNDAIMTAPAAVSHTFSAPVGDIETNEIKDFGSPNVCVLCEFVMQKLSKMIADKKTEEEIKDALNRVCSYMPQTVRRQCKEFIVNYADMILELLVREVSPKLVCMELELCLNVERQIVNPVKRCVVCEIFMDFLKTVMLNEELDQNINESLIKACKQFPTRDVGFCMSMVEQLGPQIETILRTVPVGPLVCRRLHMCSKEKTDELHLLSMDVGPSCFSGPEYWCATSANAMECDKIEYCQTNVWMSDKPGRSTLKGTDII